MSDIATRLKCALGDTGFTQKELAQMTGLTEVSISRYVNGNRVPKATTLARIADALGVGMGYFFDSVDKDTNVPSTDCISRQAAIDYVDDVPYIKGHPNIGLHWKAWVERLPSAQPEQTDCDYCHENLDGYVRPIEKNSHAFIYFGMNGWELNLRAKGWHGSAKIMYCPMCGRRLERG